MCYKKKDLICTLEIQIIVLHNLVYRLQFFVLVFFLAGETKLEAMSRSTIKRNIEGPDERLRGSSGVQPLVSPLSNRMILPQAAKANDGTGPADGGNIGEGAVMAGRVFSPSAVPGIQWMSGSPFRTKVK